MSKKPEPKPKQPDAKFRPLEGQLKALAKKAKEEEQKAKTEAKKPQQAPAPAPKKKAEPLPPQRNNLTKEERAELEALERSHSEDEFFFQRLMGGVVPLGQDNRGRVGTAPKLPPREKKAIVPQRDPDDDVRDHLMNLVEGGARFEVTDDGRRLEGRRLDLDHGTYRRLRRGELGVDARIDLHGKRADEARDALEKFLEEKRARRDRTVLVIHGRGDHSPAGIGVLRGEVAAWLSQGRPSRHVAAFATAAPEDGGEGALYVLLRP
ncbi:MAG: Smr/MutS family protein [Polyangiales bacterium]